MPPAKLRIISIRWIATGAAVALTTVTVLAGGAIGERQVRRALNRELATRVALEAQTLALTSSRALLSDFPELTLQPILLDLKTSRDELILAAVLDRNGIIRGHQDAKRLGDSYVPQPGLRPLDPKVPGEPGATLRGDDERLVATVPVRHPEGDTIGTAIVAFDRASIDAVIIAARRQQLALAGGLLALGVLGAALLMTTVLRPVGTLRAGIERIGHGDLSTRLVLRDRTEFGMLAEAINDMTARLGVAQAETLERERLTRELELARQIQASLLPRHPLHRDGWEIHGAHRPAAEVGGDYYDVFELPDDRVGMVVADVSGKGLAGCLVTSMLSASLRATRGIEDSPAAALVRLEEQLAETLMPGTFITMFYGILDPASGRLTFASAGHCPTLLYRAVARSVERLPATGIPVGAVRGGALATTLEDHTLQLAPGDLVVQYTDGITEAFEPDRQRQFGLDRLEQTITNMAGRGTGRVIDSVRSTVRLWRGTGALHDDETLLVINWREDTRRAPPAVPAADAVTDPAPLEEAMVSVRHDATTFQEAPVDDAMVLLAAARLAGHQLELGPDLTELRRLGDWIQRLPRFHDLMSSVLLILETALYEVCANIVEHGFHQRTKQPVVVYWLPPPHASVDSTIADGRFVITDHGAPFKPYDHTPPDLHDPAVRTMGRGLGLPVIYRSMSHVAYHPGTAAGNITVLGFDPDHGRQQEVQSA